MTKMEAYHFLSQDRGEEAFLANTISADTHGIHRGNISSRLKTLAYLKRKGKSVRLAPFTTTKLLVDNQPFTWEKLDLLWRARSLW